MVKHLPLPRFFFNAHFSVVLHNNYCNFPELKLWHSHPLHCDQPDMWRWGSKLDLNFIYYLFFIYTIPSVTFVWPNDTMTPNTLNVFQKRPFENVLLSTYWNDYCVFPLPMVLLSAFQKSCKDFFIFSVTGQCVVQTSYFLVLPSP